MPAKTRSQARLRISVVAALVLVGGPFALAQAAVIVRKPGAATAQLAQALTKALEERANATVRHVDLTGDTLADGALVARETRNSTVLFAIGHEATEAAGEARGLSVVSLGVPNPARVRTAGAYLSIYPRFEKLFEFVKNRLKAMTAGLVFSPSQNREVALTFLKAAESAGLELKLVPVAVTSSGDLVRELGQTLPKVDVVLLAVDPILFNKESLSYITGEARKAKKPTIGFLEDLTRLGVTVSIVAPAQAVAASAIAAAQTPVLMGKKRVDVDGFLVLVSRKEAEAVGINPEALGADRIVQ